MSKVLQKSSCLLLGALLALASASLVRARPTIARERSAAALPRALWVWDAHVISDSALRQELFGLCQRKGIGTLFIETGSVFIEPEHAARIKVGIDARQLQEFLAAAHASGLLVHALDGDPSFALTDRHTLVLGRLDSALAYNRAAPPNARLDGFQWDIEPYLTDQYKVDQKAVLIQYLALAGALRDEVRAQQPEFSLGFTLPFWLASADHAVAYGGVEKPAAFQLQDILNTLPRGYVALMSYRNHATNEGGTISIAAKTIEYASQHAPCTRVWIGQETNAPRGEPASISFYGLPASALDEAIAQIGAAYAGRPVVAGVAIHDWKAYVKLLGSGLVTIDTPAAGASIGHEANVSGHIRPGSGSIVQISVKPVGDVWYPQQQVAVAADGSWNAQARLGNASTAPGTGFSIKAQLKDDAGQDVGQGQVEVILR